MTPDASISGNHSYSFMDTAVIVCSALGGPSNTFQWSKDGQPLVNEVSNTLTLPNITSMAGGMYSCLVSNRAGSDNATVRVTVRPYFTSPPISTGGRNLASINLTCEAEGFPMVSYRWEKVDGVIQSEVAGVDSNTLVFEELQNEDQGDYVCTAESAGVRVPSDPATLTGMSIK